MIRYGEKLGFLCITKFHQPNRVYLSMLGVKFTAEAGDPKGTWTVAINVRDTLRNVTIPLQSSFEMR